MKKLEILKKIRFTELYTLFIVLLLSIYSDAQTGTERFKLITPNLVAQGQSFSGTIVEEINGESMPLIEGSSISVMGKVVEVGTLGKIEIPICPELKGTFPITATVVAIPGQERLKDGATAVSNQLNILPLSPQTPQETALWTTSEIVGPARVFTVKGTRVTYLKDEALIDNTGKRIPLTELASSFYESKYIVNAAEFPEGPYRFTATDAKGDTYLAKHLSLNPTLEMSGPALKHKGQKGKLKINTNADGVIVLSGGLPIIQLHPSEDMSTLPGANTSTVYKFPIHKGVTKKIAFTAQQVGQYTVTATMYADNEIPDDWLDSPAAFTQEPLVLNYNSTANTTEIVSAINVFTNGATPLENTAIAVVLANETSPAYLELTTDAYGVANINTSIPGALSNNAISLHLVNVAGHAIVQEGGSGTVNYCYLPDTEKEDENNYENIFRNNKEVWGNYQGVCGTGLIEMARNHPKTYADFNDYEKQIDAWLNGDDKDFENPEDFNEYIREFYVSNKETWGNYQGLCGTALMEMARFYPDLYEAFLDFENSIALLLNGENEGQDEAEDIDENMREVYKNNKETWGNYQGICGTGLMEIARLHPELYQDFLKNEKRIEALLNEDTKNAKKDTDEDGFENPEEDEPEKKESSSEENQDNGAQEEKEATKSIGDVDFEDERIKRAFESDNVEAFRTITIRLGGVEAGVTKIGDHYIITEKKSIAIDPETGTAVSYFDFKKGKIVEGQLWYAMYLMSLGNNPLNLVSRIVEDSESLGRAYLDELMKTMQDENSASIVVEITSEMLLLMQVTVSFEQAAMPQLGDHVRSANTHFEKALVAAENGDWLEAWDEINQAECDMAMLLLELWPGGSSGKGVVKGGTTIAKPVVEATTGVARKMDNVVDVMRTAAKNESSKAAVTQITKKADAIEKMASKSNKVRKVFDIGVPRPSNFATAAKDRKALENFFGVENVSTLGRRKPSNVLVITATTADGKKVKQVWVRPQYSDYKKAYLDVHKTSPVGCDIDHIQSRTRAAQNGYGYIQVVPVDSKVNRDWGRTMEKRTVKMGKAGHVEPSGTPDIKKIDQFQWWKIQGIGPDVIKERVANAVGK